MKTVTTSCPHFFKDGAQLYFDEPRVKQLLTFIRRPRVEVVKCLTPTSFEVQELKPTWPQWRRKLLWILFRR